MAVGNRFNGTVNGRLLLKEKPFGECTHQLSLPATSDFCPNHAPVAADSGWTRGRAQHDHGGKQETNGGKLAFIRAVRLSPATGWPGPLPVLFNRLSCHKQVLCFFLDSRKKRTPFVPLRPPRSCPLSCSSGSAPRSGAKGCAFPAGRCSFAISPARRQPPFASSPARRPDQSEAA